MKQPRFTVTTLVLTGILLTACSDAGSGVQTINMEARAMHYQPATIEVVAGQPVKLTLQNMDTVDHDFSVLEIPVELMGATQEPMPGHDMGGMAGEAQLHMAAMMGESATLEFTPTKPGTYEFFCTVAGHKEAGMVGTLIVKAP